MRDYLDWQTDPVERAKVMLMWNMGIGAMIVCVAMMGVLALHGDYNYLPECLFAAGVWVLVFFLFRRTQSLSVAIGPFSVVAFFIICFAQWLRGGGIDYILMIWFIQHLIFTSIMVGKRGGQLLLIAVIVAFGVFIYVKTYHLVHNYVETEAQREPFTTWIITSLSLLCLMYLLQFFLDSVTNTQETLTTQNLMFTAVMESAHDSIFAIDKDFKLVSFNNIFRDLTEYLTGKVPVVGSHLSVAFTDDLKIAYEHLIQHLDLSFNGEEHYELRTMPTKLGTFYFETNYTPILNDENKIWCVSVFSKDVTERVQAEQKLRQREEELNEAQRLAHLGSWVYVPKNGELTWSAENFRIHGVAKDTYTPQAITYSNDFIHPEDRYLYDDLVRRIASSRELNYNYRIFRPGSTVPYYIQAIVRPVFDENGVLQSVIGAVLDITESKNVELELQQSQKMLLNQAEDLKRSNTELERFAYITSHDLREPVRTTLGLLQFLKHRYATKMDEIGGQILENAMSSAERISTLIQSVLEFSRVGRNFQDTEHTDLNELVRTVLVDLGKKISEEEASIQIMSLPELVVQPLEMKQLFQNLIGNALKFHNPHETPHVEIAAEERTDEWLFWVKDNGIGIDKNYHDTVFEIFRRLNGRDDYEGTGIGLAICRKIIMQRGGHIWFESALGEGTTFFFTLPKEAPTDILGSSYASESLPERTHS